MADPTKPTNLPPLPPLPDLPPDLVDPGVSPDLLAPVDDARPHKPWYLRWHLWDRDDWVQLIVVALLALLVLGEVSDWYSDRSQAKVNGRIACQVDNVAETNNASIQRLRELSPVLEAARELSAATDAEDQATAVQKVRDRVVQVGQATGAHLELKDCKL